MQISALVYWQEFWTLALTDEVFHNKLKLADISLKTADSVAKIANVLDKSFVNSVLSLVEKGGCSGHVLPMNDEKDPLDKIITHFKYHPSIIDIIRKWFFEKFDFTLCSTYDVLSELNKLDHIKSTTGINVELLKDSADICAPILTRIFNSCIANGVLPDKLNISPIFK